MALFSDNDREKVIDDEIDVDDVDKLDDDQDQDGDHDDDQDHRDDDAGKDKKLDAKKEDPKPEDQPDYWKKKFQESSRENQLERERREAAERKAEELAKPKEITDDLMKQKYPDWDGYDEAVKAALKGQVRVEQELTALKQSQSEYHNERKWQGQVDSFLDENAETERYAIKDREAFKKFCNKPERKGMNIDVLAQAFLYEVGTSAPADDDKSKGKRRTSMLEDGSGAGASGKHTTDKKKYTADDAKKLRENNPREYERLVRSGELKLDV